MRELFSVCLLAVYLLPGAACADYFYGLVNGHVAYHLTDDSVVMPGAEIRYDSFVVESTLRLENQGKIYSDIFIESGHELTFQNSGGMFGTVRVAAGAGLVQLVGGIGDMNGFGIERGAGSSFIMLAEGIGTAGIDFAKLAAFASDADKLILKDSVLILSSGAAPAVPIEILGNVQFVIRDSAARSDSILLRGVSVLGDLSVRAESRDLFNVNSEIRGGDLYLSIRRETDYEKIIGPARGRFLNRMRADSVASNFLSRLDSAQSMAELRGMMNDSITFNPARLMKPVKILSQAMGASGGSGYGFGSAAIFGSDLSLYSGAVSLGLSAGDFSFAATGYAGESAEQGDDSEISGLFYGGASTVRYQGSFIRADAGIGFAFANFNAGANPVFDGSGAVYDLSGRAVYGFAEVGARVFDDAVYVEPLARVWHYRARALDSADVETKVGAGAAVGRRTSSLGIGTDYSAYAILETKGAQAGIRADIEIPNDDIAVGLDFAVMKIDSEFFYKFGAGVRLEF